MNILKPCFSPIELLCAEKGSILEKQHLFKRIEFKFSTLRVFKSFAYLFLLLNSAKPVKYVTKMRYKFSLISFGAICIIFSCFI